MWASGLHRNSRGKWVARDVCVFVKLEAMELGLPSTDVMNEALSIIHSSQKIVLLTGAGISTDSGIPDFRGPNGLWTKNPKAEKISHISHYISDPEVRRLAWQSRVNSPNWSAAPNDGHHAIVKLDETGKLHTLVTQNIDELHQQSGIHPSKVVEVHGTMRWSRCWSCEHRLPMQETLERVRAGEEDPACLLCGGILKSDTISFGQALVPEVIDRAMTAAEESDLLIAIGTTLAVGPVNQMVPRAKATGSHVIIVNGGPTEMDHYAHVVLQGGITPILRALFAGVEFPT